MNLRFCVPVVVGRGAGLGNELVPWCRSFLAAQLLNARSVPPAFGLNRRGYGRHFGTRPWDWFTNRALQGILPAFDLTEHEFRKHGGGDCVTAINAFADEHQLRERSAWVLTTQGMWGGMRHIEAARDYARSVLYLSRFAPRNLLRLRSRIDETKPLVGIHVRLGDFEVAASAENYRGKFNIALPMDWYRNVAQSIHAQCNGNVQFLVVSDSPESSLADLVRDLPCILSADIPDSDCSDLLALSNADLLICSVSTYSIWAAFLSGAPYIWYAPNLHMHDDAFQSIWGGESGQGQAGSSTLASIAAWKRDRPLQVRGWPVGDEGAVPENVVATMLARMGNREADLVRYGVVPLAQAQVPSARAVRRASKGL